MATVDVIKNKTFNTQIAGIGSSNIDIFTIGETKSAFWEGYVSSGTNIRSFILMATWQNVTVTFNEYSTVDIGDTTDITFNITSDGTNITLSVTNSGASTFDIRLHRKAL